MGALLLLITTFIWGTAFLAQKIGGNVIGPFAVTALRNVLGGAFLLALIALRRGGAAAASRRKYSILAGIACGVPLYCAMLTQQIGIEYTTPGISAFLTTNYVLFVPLMAAALARKWPEKHIALGVALALTGTYFICMTGGESLFKAGIGRGEAWTILCALLFSVQMMAVDRLAPKADLLVMSASQLFTCAILGLPFLALPSEAAALGNLLSAKAMLSLVYLGIFSSGIAYTLQNVGQSRTPAPVAAVLLSLESVFGALSGWLVFGDRMTTAQFCGCALVFLAAVGTQLRDAFAKKGVRA